MGKRWRRSARYFGACRAAGIGIPVGRWGNETLDPGENLCLIRVPRDFRDQFQRSGCLVCGDRGIAFYAHSVCWAGWFWNGDSGPRVDDGRSQQFAGSERNGRLRRRADDDHGASPELLSAQQTPEDFQ